MISAIILAAGASKRMGQQKLLMKWGNMTVIEHVISVFKQAGIEDILLITGSSRTQIEELVAGQPASARTIFNANHHRGEMLSSIQCGLAALRETNSSAALVGLGDQPQIEEGTVRQVFAAYQEFGSPIVVPSYQMRRGHPWLVDRRLWQEFLDLKPPLTPREFLSAHSKDIRHVEVNTPSILADLDTMQDYRKSMP